MASYLRAAVEREAAWLRFLSDIRFAIRIFIGGVDGISGELIIPDTATLLRRQNGQGIGKRQDYVVLPEQP